MVSDQVWLAAQWENRHHPHDHQSHNGYSPRMREITAREAKNRFGQLLRSAQRGPVRVTRNGTPVGVMLSVEQFERLRGIAWDGLAAAMDAMSRQAAANGLTPEALECLPDPDTST